MHHGSSLLLDLDGVIVESCSDGRRQPDRADRNGTRMGRDVPQCGMKSSRSKGWVTTRPRDVQVGPDRPLLVWRKRKWLCTNTSCDRKVFTESTPGVPSRARVTPRAKALLVEAVLDGDRSVSAVAGDYGCAWHTVHGHLVVVADAALAGEPEPVMVLGIDETDAGRRNGKLAPRPGNGDGWTGGTRLVDLTGDQGLLAQVNGRTSAVVIDWFDARDETWKAQITHVAIDMSSVYAKAVREALPHAQLVVDRFHLVKKANEMVDTVRRRVTQAERGRRGRKSDVEWINRRRLLRASERLTNEQRSALFEKLTAADPHGTSLRHGSPKNYCAMCCAAPIVVAFAMRSGTDCIGSTRSARHAVSRRSASWRRPSRRGRNR
uniref:Putative transposase n=1 Tax=Nocardia asteroides TaxID=1824 RepID=Q50911_NOCAS|nr:putative transposase [Nocardia asteroides]